MIGFTREKKNTQIMDFVSHLVLIVHVFVFGPIYLLFMIPISLFIYHVGHSVFMHRHLSHDQFIFSNWKKFILHIFAIISNMGKLPGYIAIHIKHHKYSGTNRDPHEWRVAGFWPIFFSNWNIFHERTDTRLLASTFKKSKYMKFFTKFHYQILLVLLPIFGGVTAMCFWWKQVSVILVHLDWGDLSHRKGSDTSNNNIYL